MISSSAFSFLSLNLNQSSEFLKLPLNFLRRSSCSFPNVFFCFHRHITLLLVLGSVHAIQQFFIYLFIYLQ